MIRGKEKNIFGTKMRSVINEANGEGIVALSGGYSRVEANEKLAKNHKIIASFSRALTEGLSVSQSNEAFNKMLDEAI